MQEYAISREEMLKWWNEYEESVSSEEIKYVDEDGNEIETEE